MKKIQIILLKILSSITGNYFMQRLLQSNMLLSQYLMGIGTGGSVEYSGEKSCFKLLIKHRLPYCIFDIGSNKGQFLQLAIDNMPKEGVSIHCFEPAKETFEILSNAYKNNSKVKLNNIGIAKKPGSKVLYYDEAGSGLASLAKRDLDYIGINFNKSEKVKIDTIDNYCLNHKIKHIHLLKLDIEGYELDALQGANSMFSNNAIDIVMFEFGGCNIDTRTFFQDFFIFFEKLDMSMFRITPSGYLYLVDSYSVLNENFNTTNFVAIKRG